MLPWFTVWWSQSQILASLQNWTIRVDRFCSLVYDFQSEDIKNAWFLLVMSLWCPLMTAWYTCSAGRYCFNSETFTFFTSFRFFIMHESIKCRVMIVLWKGLCFLRTGLLFASGHLNPLIQPSRVHLDFIHIQLLPLSLVFVLCSCNRSLGYWVTGSELLLYLGSVAVAYWKRWVKISLILCFWL